MGILYLHKSHNTPLLPPKFCIIIVCNLFWDMKMSQEKSKTVPMQIFLGVEAVCYDIAQVENNQILSCMLFSRCLVLQNHCSLAIPSVDQQLRDLNSQKVSCKVLAKTVISWGYNPKKLLFYSNQEGHFKAMNIHVKNLANANETLFPVLQLSYIFHVIWRPKNQAKLKSRRS